MARKWTTEEESKYRDELLMLYVHENKTIHDIAIELGIKFQTVYVRLQRLGIASIRSQKRRYNNKRNDIQLPVKQSSRLAELFGILMGDGHVSHFQTFVTLGSKEHPYALHVQKLLYSEFRGTPRITVRKSGKNLGHRTVYLGSTLVTEWLRKQGFVANKVQAQVDVPQWIFKRKSFVQAFLRGFFDTDGSVYRLRYGIQMSFTNRSIPLLESIRKMLMTQGYSPSRISAWRVYVTQKKEIIRFFREIGPVNPKHVRRFEEMV